MQYLPLSIVTAYWAHYFQLLLPRNFALGSRPLNGYVEKNQDAPSSYQRWHASLPARLMANAVQFQTYGCLLILEPPSLLWQEGTHGDRDSRRKLTLGLMSSHCECSPEGPEFLPKSVSRGCGRNIHCRCRPKWKSREDRGSASGSRPNTT